MPDRIKRIHSEKQIRSLIARFNVILGIYRTQINQFHEYGKLMHDSNATRIWRYVIVLLIYNIFCLPQFPYSGSWECLCHGDLTDMQLVIGNRGYRFIAKIMLKYAFYLIFGS